MQPPKLKFEVLVEAAKYNFDILREKNINLGKVLETNKTSVTSYGSNFKNIKASNNLLKNHPQWKTLRSRLKYGIVFPTSKVPKKFRENDTKTALERGSHKSSIKNQNF